MSGAPLGEKQLLTMAQALALAEPGGYVRTFVDEGSPMAELLSEALEVRQRDRLDPPIPAHYLRKLLAALEQGVPSVTPPGIGLPEPLSERELEVLVLLAASKSNRQIAVEHGQDPHQEHLRQARRAQPHAGRLAGWGAGLALTRAPR